MIYYTTWFIVIHDLLQYRIYYNTWFFNFNANSEGPIYILVHGLFYQELTVHSKIKYNRITKVFNVKTFQSHGHIMIIFG